jgi:hypothetical protein
MSFDDAFVAQPGLQWDSKTFNECRNEMALRGCTLWPDVDRSYVPLTAGVALLPHLSFNRKGELVTINMQKIMRGGDITAAQCERVHSQMLDHLDAQWGRGKPREDDGSGSKWTERKTPKGRKYSQSNEGTMVFFQLEDFNALPDGRKISILSHYTATLPDCWVSVYFDGPKSLERPPLEEPD